MPKGRTIMQNGDSTLLQILVESMPVAALSLFGGLVSLFNRKGSIPWKAYVGGLLAALFVGFIFNLALLEYGFTERTRIIVVMVSSYCARDVLDIIRDKFISKIKSELDE